MNEQKQVGTNNIIDLRESTQEQSNCRILQAIGNFPTRKLPRMLSGPLYDHLVNLDFAGKTKKIDLYIYSRGGDVSVPWTVASMVREFCDEFNILIPYKAHSAATLRSLGADNIIMGRKAELAPIDPTLVRGTAAEALPTSIDFC